MGKRRAIHGVDRALNPGPTGVLRRSTELVRIRVGPVSLLLVYRTMNPTSFLASFPTSSLVSCTASSETFSLRRTLHFKTMK